MTRTANLFTCSDCNGSKTVEILDAYDLDFKKSIPCPSCDGVGFVAANKKVAVIITGVEDTKGLN